MSLRRHTALFLASTRSEPRHHACQAHVQEKHDREQAPKCTCRPKDTHEPPCVATEIPQNPHRRTKQTDGKDGDHHMHVIRPSGVEQQLAHEDNHPHSKEWQQKPHRNEDVAPEEGDKASHLPSEPPQGGVFRPRHAGQRQNQNPIRHQRRPPRRQECPAIKVFLQHP